MQNLFKKNTFYFLVFVPLAFMGCDFLEQVAPPRLEQVIHPNVAKAIKKVIKDSVDQAVQDMEDDFSKLSKEQIQKTEEITSQTVEKTAIDIAKTALETTEKAIEDMEGQFADLSEKEMQAIKTIALEVARQVAQEVAKQTAETEAQGSVGLMKQEFMEDSQKEMKRIEQLAEQTAKNTARITNIEDNEIESLFQERMESLTQRALEEVDVGLQQEYLSRLSSHLAFEQCDWKNRDYTTRIIKDHTFFAFTDPLTSLINRWEEFKKESRDKQQVACSDSQPVEDDENQASVPTCSQTNSIAKEYAYLSPLYDEFILSFFKESIQEKQLSENDVPLECFFAGAVRGANIYTSTNNYYYCEADSERPSTMEVVDENQRTRVIGPQRACLNRDYSFLTAKAFNKTADCFGFNKSDKETIFKLFNHESSFLHNVKSSTSARCYGQLTTIALEEINKQIYFSDATKPFPYSFIFNEVIEKCPGLQKAVLNPEIYEPRNKKSMKHFNSLFSKTAINCKITQNPYSCLFYAFYNIKMNMINIEQQWKGATSSFGKRNKISEDFKSTFSLPILLPEMRGVTTINGKNMVFWDDSEIWPFLKKKSMDQIEDIKRLPLFENEVEVKNLFNLWAYNGGISISDYMKNFIQKLKKSIAKRCSPQAKSKTCQYRFAVQEGRGIATKDIKKDFQAYILKNYKTKKGRKRKLEVKNFVHKVETNLNYLYNKNGEFKYHLKNLVPEINNKDVEGFQDHLKDICPKVDSTLL